MHRIVRTWATEALIGLWLLTACAAEPQSPATAAQGGTIAPPPSAAGAGAPPAVATAQNTNPGLTSAGAGGTRASATTPSAGQAAPLPPAPVAMNPAPGAAGAPAMGPRVPSRGPAQPSAAGGSPAPAPPPAAMPGPDDGDPSKPMVALTEVPCRAPNAVTFGIGKPNFKVDDRDVIIDYPCNKHEGAPMTFILNLHGTTPVAQHFYQEGYFSAHKYVASHNLIIATPSSVVQQWGNGDNGADLPYLMNVIAWVYNTLGTKFDIRSMWVGGHSWGAMYTSTFGCRAELADKVRGLIIMSGLPTLPSCSSKMSVIDTNAEMDIAQPLNQANLPMQHGCKEPTMNMLGNNTQTLWSDCMPGYVHSNYLMLGKMHADFMDDVVVKSIVDLIKSARP